MGFPLFAIIYGFDYRHYEMFFDSHADEVLRMTIGSGVGMAEAIHQATDTLSTESPIHAILWGVLLVCAKSVFGVIATAFATWVLRGITPTLKKKWKEFKTKYWL